MTLRATSVGDKLFTALVSVGSTAAVGCFVLMFNINTRTILNESDIKELKGIVSVHTAEIKNQQVTEAADIGSIRAVLDERNVRISILESKIIK